METKNYLGTPKENRKNNDDSENQMKTKQRQEHVEENFNVGSKQTMLNLRPCLKRRDDFCLGFP
jgi:hypothetical protein